MFDKFIYLINKEFNKINNKSLNAEIKEGMLWGVPISSVKPLKLE